MERDEARIWTDNRLAEMELHLKQVYSQAQHELTAKWNAYMQRGEARLANLYADYVGASPENKPAALKRYQDAMQNFTLRNEWYKAMIDDTTFRLAHVNEIAIAYINGQMPEIYVQNFNAIDPSLLGMNVNWTIRNAHMVKNLMLDSLPQKELNYAKDMRWNQRQINNSVLQGILQGESMDKIARRLLPIVANNRASAIRTARTMVTGAENRGRMDRYREYEAEGVVMGKVWLATPDGRTRDWHLSMDYQEVPVEDPFIDGLGNELDYPGDDEAPPETVYNCRCSMKSHLIGIKDSRGRVHKFDYSGDKPTMHSVQVAAERARRGDDE